VADSPRRAATVAVIPARGGSKRIPRKNIKLFRGVPLLAGVIQRLQQSGVFDSIVVSTDDDEIAAVAEGAGADVPFRRPASLSDDFTGTAPVMAHAVTTIAAPSPEPALVCCVYPAAVLALPADFAASLDRLCRGHLDYVFTATSFPHPIQRALRRGADDTVEMFWPEHRLARSQDLEPAYHDAGMFYWGTRDAWIEQRPIFSSRSALYLIPRSRVQDIDTDEDWHRAEMIAHFIGEQG
jgi:N-acylneuraminate cytidylyltransferase